MMGKEWLLKYAMGLFLFAATAFNATVSAGVSECRNCTDAMYVARARSGGIGEHLIHDFKREKIQRFVVDCPGVTPNAIKPTRGDTLLATLHQLRDADRTVTPCAQTLRVRKLRLDPVLLASFKRALDFRKAAGGDDTLIVALDMRQVEDAEQHLRQMSAYEIVSSGNARFQLGNWMQTAGALPLSAHAETALSALRQDELAFLFNNTLGVHIRIAFVDGTSAEYWWSLASNRNDMMAESARIDGNLIPDLLDRGAQGTYRFSNAGAATSFVNWLASQGIAVTSASEPLKTVICAWAGQELSCRRG